MKELKYLTEAQYQELHDLLYSYDADTIDAVMCRFGVRDGEFRYAKFESSEGYSDYRKKKGDEFFDFTYREGLDDPVRLHDDLTREESMIILEILLDDY